MSSLPVRLTYLYNRPVEAVMKNGGMSTFRVTYWPVLDGGFINFKAGGVTLLPGSDKSVGICLCGNRFVLDENGDLPTHYLLTGSHTAKPCQYAHLPPASLILGYLRGDTIEHLEPKHKWAFMPLHHAFRQPKYILPASEQGLMDYPDHVGESKWRLRKSSIGTATQVRRKGWLKYGQFILETGTDPLKHVGPEAVEAWTLEGVARSMVVGLDPQLEIKYEWEMFKK